MSQKETNDALRIAFRAEEIEFEDYRPGRIRVAYRILRHHATIKGIVNRDETLSTALPTISDDDTPQNPWLIPLTIKKCLPHLRAARISYDLYSILERAERLPPNFHVLTTPLLPAQAHGAAITAAEDTENQLSTRPQSLPGLALLPPPPPPHQIDPLTNSTKPEYDPLKHDPLLCIWCEAMESIARSPLNTFLTLPADPLLAKYGNDGLFDPARARAAWPTAEEIMAWEDMLVVETMQTLVEDGHRQTREELKNRHGFTAEEVSRIMDLAKLRVRDIDLMDLDAERAFMRRRLEAFIDRAKDSFDMRAELAAYKQLSIILGLAQGGAEGFDDMAERVIRTHAGPPNQRALPNE
jgi:hypothetical protein